MTPILLCFRNAKSSEASHAAYQTAHRLIRDLPAAIHVDGHGYILPNSAALRSFLNAIIEADDVREGDLSIAVFELGALVLGSLTDHTAKKLQELGIESFPLGFPRPQGGSPSS
jgi:hypothetical protein